MPLLENIIVGRDQDDLKKFGESGTAFIGMHIVGEGEESKLTNAVLMDVTKPHVVLVVGKRGTGKCVEENTPIILEDGSIVPIKDLESDSRKVMGLDQKLKINPLEKSEFFKRKVNKLLHIKTRSGRQIKLTHEHPLLTIKGWVPVKDLTIGSRIATPRKVESFGSQEMDEHKIKLLAYLIAEGHLKNDLVRFTNNDPEIAEDFKQSVEAFDPNLRALLYRKGSYGVSQKKKIVDISGLRFDENGNFKKGSRCITSKNSMQKWLTEVGCYGSLSVKKTMPDCVFQFPKPKVSLFLNRLFSCDGSIYKIARGDRIQWEISYSSGSGSLIRSVQHLLLRFGIISKLRDKKTKLNGKIFDVFELVIGGEQVKNFVSEIGFYGIKKNRQEEFLKTTAHIIRNPNIDTIPKEIWDVYRPQSWSEIGRQIGYSTPKGFRSSINYAPSRQKLIQVAQVDNNEVIYTIATSDIFWDEIVFMEELEGDFNVCDITVPEMHNFVASDIIVHNSYSGAVIAEEMALLPKEVRENLSVLMIDTMGIFWSMKNPNEKGRSLLKDWKRPGEKKILEPMGMEAKLFVPKAYTKTYKDSGVDVDYPLTLPCGELSSDDWIITFGFSSIDSHGIAIERAIKQTKLKYGTKYDLSDIIKIIDSDKRTEPLVKEALINRFEAAQEWGIFEKEGTPISSLFQAGTVSVIDVSHYMRVSGGWNVRSLLVGLLSRRIFMERLIARKSEEFETMSGEAKKKVPMVWIMIDEAHQFVGNSETTAATDPLLTLIKEGREPGISVLLITQRPGKLHEDVLAQADLIISHRLTSRSDLEALRSIMQTYMMDDIHDYINSLPKNKGSAIILDDNSERIFAVQIRPRLSWHAGGSPSAIKEKSVFG